MLYSEEKKFIFIAVPKTGSTAVERHLCRLDPEVIRNHAPRTGGGIQRVPTHVTAKRVVEIMGDRAEDFKFVAFLREPTSVLVSKYYFYRNGRASKLQEIIKKDHAGGHRIKMKQAAKVLSSKILPLRTWVRFYPFSSSVDYLYDDQGENIVGRLGLQEDLQHHFVQIFTELGYCEDELQLEIANRTDYETVSFEGNSKLPNAVYKRLANDIELYKRVRARHL